tara:strand:+ start:1317 stop:1544 length:228 start_codon:yes stop_codon:yes gene_type:complete
MSNQITKGKPRSPTTRIDVIAARIIIQAFAMLFTAILFATTVRSSWSSVYRGKARKPPPALVKIRPIEAAVWFDI